jgi:hypothetical protein
MRGIPLLSAMVMTTALASTAGPAIADEAARLDFFEKKVRPILVNNCYTCHSASTKPSGGLRVDDRTGLLTGGNSGPAVVPGDPDKGSLLRRVTSKDDKQRMPREGKPLTPDEIANLAAWIKDGAAWPAVKPPASFGKPKPKYEALKKEHWAWQPLTDPKPPAVADVSWPRDDIDRFILAKLEDKGLKPVSDANRVALLRRVTFDLTGLPPSPAEVEAFLADPAPDAFAKVVDRLLASPGFGERWGRHWLDVARYGESTGPSRNIPYPLAWKYRDYVLDSVNRDVPFDRFVTEQIAGDLLPAEPGPERDRLLTATGFLALGVKDVNQRFKVRFLMDNVDEQIDVVMRSVLALTVSCARCHDHKFDPVAQADYYALAGIFTSTDNCAGVRNKMGGSGLDYYDPSLLLALSSEGPPPPAEQVAKLKAEVAEAKKAWDAIRNTPEGLAKGPDGFPKQRPIRLRYERLEAELLALTDPVARGQVVHGVRDAKSVGDTELRVRGEAEKLGPVVPRGFLTVFDVPGAAPVNPKQSGRLELAGWLVSPKNPLTPRVIVNRVWAHLFGRGLVGTVDNFGVTGDVPSHPELLDHLASRFLRDGWSVKKLVRTLVLTRAYQLSSEATAAHRQADPANRLVWRHSPRRLDAEEIRDAMLAAAGTLNRNQPAGSPVQQLRMIEMGDNGPEAAAIHSQADRSLSRSVYLPLIRGLTPRALEAFDPVDQTLVSGSRDATTVPGQALYLLNSSFVRRQALALADRLLTRKESTDHDVIDIAYRRTLGRSPNAAEVRRAQVFLQEYESAARDSRVDLDKSGEPAADGVRPKDARTAAWLAFVQALFGSAEFRYLP